MAGKIFINYRRDDTIAAAGRLYDRLAQAFGRRNLFLDVDHIPAGVDFAGYLNEQVGACDVFLAVIGPKWLESRDETDARRIDNPEDFVAIEIAAALARDIRVIPVLIDGTPMPKPAELPEHLRPLARRNAVEVRNSQFGRDAEVLVEKIRGALKNEKSGGGRAVITAAVAAMLMLGSGVLAFQLGVPMPWSSSIDGGQARQAEPTAKIGEQLKVGEQVKIGEQVKNPADDVVSRAEAAKKVADEARARTDAATKAAEEARTRADAAKRVVEDLKSKRAAEEAGRQRMADATPSVSKRNFTGVQRIPILSYRTGAYAPIGIPLTNGMVDYYKLLNERDGGVNGVRLEFEECETGYATDKGVECYELSRRTVGFVSTTSTGIIFALAEKAPQDKIALLTLGSGRGESKNGSVFPWNFPLLGTSWTAAQIAILHIGEKFGGADGLKGKKITLLHHDSPYGREPISILKSLAQKYGFDFEPIAVTHPGVEQKAQWIAIRNSKPDYVLLWSWGVMTSTALKEAAAVGYPRERMIGFWWAGAEPDVVPAGSNAIGYQALMLHHGSMRASVHTEIERFVYATGNGSGDKSKISEVLYNRGLVTAMLSAEAIRTAQRRYGEKSLSGEQIRWGFENLDLSGARIRELGFDGMMRPIKTSCADHQGSNEDRLHQWDGKEWRIASSWYRATDPLSDLLVQELSMKYAAERKLTPRNCAAGG